MTSGVRVGGVLTVLMWALAAGAVWCALAMFSRTGLTFLALPVAAIIAWAARSNGLAASIAGAIVAAAFTTLACFYAQYLLAAAEIASTLNLPFREGLTRSGFGMVTTLMDRRLGTLDWALFGAAIVFAALLALRRR